MTFDLGGPAELELLRSALKESLGGVELRLSGVEPRVGGQHLKIGSGDGQEHQVPGIFGRKLSGVRHLPRRTVVVESGEIGDGLRYPRADIQNIEWSDQGGK